jgi:50S ribosomal subunit-associated GTPase HflX
VEVRVGDTEAAVRCVVCHNPAEAEAERDRARRQARIERIERELARLKEQRERATSKTEREAHPEFRTR